MGKNSYFSVKGVNDKVWLGEKIDPLVTVQEIEFWPYNQMVYA